MNSDIKILNIEWGTQYSITNFEDHVELHASVIILDPQYLWLVYLYILYLICKWLIGGTNCLYTVKSLT